MSFDLLLRESIRHGIFHFRVTRLGSPERVVHGKWDLDSENLDNCSL